MKNVLEHLMRIGLFLLVFLSWMWVLVQPFPAYVDFAVIIGAVALIFPVVWVGRLLLDRDPTPRNAEWLTAFVHAVILALRGAALIRAGISHESWRLWGIPVPPAVPSVFQICPPVVSLRTPR